MARINLLIDNAGVTWTLPSQLTSAHPEANTKDKVFINGDLVFPNEEETQNICIRVDSRYAGHNMRVGWTRFATSDTETSPIGWPLLRAAVYSGGTWIAPFYMTKGNSQALFEGEGYKDFVIPEDSTNYEIYFGRTGTDAYGTAVTTVSGIYIYDMDAAEIISKSTAIKMYKVMKNRVPEEIDDSISEDIINLYFELDDDTNVITPYMSGRDRGVRRIGFHQDDLSVATQFSSGLLRQLNNNTDYYLDGGGNWAKLGNWTNLPLTARSITLVPYYSVSDAATLTDMYMEMDENYRAGFRWRPESGALIVYSGDRVNQCGYFTDSAGWRGKWYGYSPTDNLTKSNVDYSAFVPTAEAVQAYVDAKVTESQEVTDNQSNILAIVSALADHGITVNLDGYYTDNFETSNNISITQGLYDSTNHRVYA